MGAPPLLRTTGPETCQLMTERHCPRCSQPMALGKLGPLDLDLCLACAGIWFDTGELSRLISAGPDVVLRLAERLHASTLRPNVRSLGGPSCPACRSALESTDYGALRGVSVDACRWCEGVWITRTSLTRLSVALRGASEWQVLAMEQPGGASAVTAPAAPPMAHQPPPPAVAQPIGRSPLQPTLPPQPPAHPGATRVAPRLEEAPTSARPGMLGCPKVRRAELRSSCGLLGLWRGLPGAGGRQVSAVPGCDAAGFRSRRRL